MAGNHRGAADAAVADGCAANAVSAAPGRLCELSVMAQRDPRSGFSTVYHFAQSNDKGDVPALLRSVADSIDDLNDIQVMDITFHTEPTADEDDLTMTIYYVDAYADD